jgi:hypothetical protein
VTQGDQLSFATWQGVPNDLAALAVTAVDGSPTFVLLLNGTFDPCGTWRVNVPVPSGLSGLSVGLRSFALGRFTGYVLGTNTETVIFQ